MEEKLWFWNIYST